MSILTSIQRLYRRSPLIRAIFFVAIIGIAFLIASIIGRNVNKKPIIDNINPAVGSPGDIMVIKGQNFGTLRNSSYVEISSSRVTSSGYLSWSDSQIRLILPSNAQDGLVIVGTPAGKSEPVFFANESGIPVAVRPNTRTFLPAIVSIEPEEATVGQLIVIKGENFGATRDNSKVFFTASREIETPSATTPISYSTSAGATARTEFISASVFDFDYELWSDTEIQVRIPDGATDGQIYVETEKGTSSLKKISVDNSTGRKKYSGKRTYIIQVSADIANIVADSDSSVTLYVPCPVVSSFQPSVEITECFPEPLQKDNPHVIVHQKMLNQLSNRKQRFTQNFVVTNYTVTTVRTPQYVPNKDTSRFLYQQYTKSDDIIHVRSEVEELARSIIKTSIVPYNQAKLIYDYMTTNYKISQEVNPDVVSTDQLIKTKKGDAYEFTILFTEMCRALGIPAIPVSGILIEDKSTSKSHWWTELYFENFGWFPVDVALGSGIEFKPFAQIKNTRTYYYGNLDSQHVAFSRGLYTIQPNPLSNKFVYRPKTYALQSLWESSTTGTTSYSSLWNDPVILGIY